MSLIALPALWEGKDSATVMRLMADAICSIVPLAAVFSRVCLVPGEEPVGLLKVGARSLGADIPAEWLPFVDACDRLAPSSQRTNTLHSPAGPLVVLHLHMGAGRQKPHVCFGSAKPGFPTLNEVAFLRAAVSLAATGLNNARSDYERDQAHRAKDEFLAMLGHELRNPLAPIVTNLGLIRLKGSGHLAREHRVIERQVSYLSRLVDDLLDISRITRDKVELRRSVTGIHSVLTEAVEAVSPLMHERQHRISLTPDVGACVDGDPSRLRQMLSNLLNNAAKYTPDGGHIHASTTVQAGWVTISVQDDGVGMDAALVPRVFNLFEQGATDVDRARGGLGIGLAIVKKFATLHGGTAEAFSEGPGKGSRFTLRLPAVSAAATAVNMVKQHPTGAAPPAGLRILLVDDNRDALESMDMLLTHEGFEVLAFSDPAEALQKAPDFAAEVYVLDLGLPGLDGYQLASELKRTGGSHVADARFVALTGYGQASDKARTAQAGFHAHLVKPVNIEELLVTVRQT